MEAWDTDISLPTNFLLQISSIADSREKKLLDKL